MSSYVILAAVIAGVLLFAFWPNLTRWRRRMKRRVRQRDSNP
ncbi:hypothetical protein [Brevundimonas sp.]|nr:hypothetical protein [Brevundimonas sp.]MDZ4361763.1 hypothetical protein [Brevundimonas sp.]